MASQGMQKGVWPHKACRRGCGHTSHAEGGVVTRAIRKGVWSHETCGRGCGHTSHTNGGVVTQDMREGVWPHETYKWGVVTRHSKGDVVT